MKKLFSEKQVDVSALLAGPIPPGILIYMNYKRLGKTREAHTALTVTFLFTLIFFYLLFLIPASILNKIPNFLFTAFYAVIVFIFFRHFMAGEVKAAYAAGMKKASNWNVAGATVLGLVLNLVIVFLLSMDQPFYEGKVLTYKGNDIYYSENSSNKDVNTLVYELEIIDFIGPDYGNIVRLETMVDKNRITLVVDESFWADDELMSVFYERKPKCKIS